jgi:hypothetical protein
MSLARSMLPAHMRTSACESGKSFSPWMSACNRTASLRSLAAWKREQIKLMLQLKSLADGSLHD